MSKNDREGFKCILVIRSGFAFGRIFLLVPDNSGALLVGMKRFWPVIAALAAFAVYYLTTCRGIWIGDSGEFALALKTFGIAHPPGYPLFTIQGTLFVQALSFLRPIFAGGIYSITVSAAAVGIVFLIMRRRLDDLSSFGLALCWAFTAIFWAETNGVEIYTLNVLLIVATYLALESESSYKWPLTIYLFGLCLCNHPSSLALVPAILYRFFAEGEYRRTSRFPFYVGLLAVAGTMYLYLWVRSTHDPISDWGNPEGLSALWQHMSLKQYSGWVHNSWDNLLFAVQLYFRSVLECWSWLGLILILSGLGLGFKYNFARTINALTILVTSISMAAFHQAVNHEPFYLPPLFASLLLISNNLVALKSKARIRSVVSWAIVGAAAILLVLNYRANDKSDYTLYDNYSRQLLDSALPNSTIFLAGDINTFGAEYLRYGEDYRSDLTLYDRSIRKRALTERASELAGFSTTDLFEARTTIIRRERGRLYLAKSHYQNEPDWWEGLDSLFSFGMLYDTRPPIEASRVVPSYPTSHDPGDLMSRELLVNLDLIRGEELLLNGERDKAEEQFRMALSRYDIETRGVLLNQLGIYFRKSDALELALETYNRALEKPILSSNQRAEIRFNISNVHKDRANLAMESSDYVAAVQHFEEAANYDENNSRLILNIGLIYAQHLRDNNSARRYLTRYLELEPGDQRVQQLLGSLR